MEPSKPEAPQPEPGATRVDDVKERHTTHWDLDMMPRAALEQEMQAHARAEARLRRRRLLLICAVVIATLVVIGSAGALFG